MQFIVCIAVYAMAILSILPPFSQSHLCNVS